MALFTVKAGTAEGRVISKEIEAESKEEAGLRLQKEGFYPLNIRKKRVGWVGLPNLSFFRHGRTVRPAELLTFNQGFATLLKAGLSVVASIETLESSIRNKHFSRAVKDTIKEIRGGSTLSDAMRKHPEVFPRLYAASISAGERTGDLIPSIKGFIEFQKRMEAIRKKVVSSLTYPIVLTVASIAVVGFLVTYVVPSFAKIYADSGSELPRETTILLHTVDFLKSHLPVLIATGITLAIGLRSYLQSGNGKIRLDSIKLSIPYLGEVHREYSISKFARTLGMVLTSGIPLIQALEMSGEVLNNSVLERKLDSIIKRTTEGSTVTDAMKDTDFMPDITLRMFEVGEKSASLSAITEEIADYHGQEVNHKVEILTDMLEPALMVITGIIIGTIVVLMYLPIFQLGARV